MPNDLFGIPELFWFSVVCISIEQTRCANSTTLRCEEMPSRFRFCFLFALCIHPHAGVLLSFLMLSWPLVKLLSNVNLYEIHTVNIEKAVLNGVRSMQ